MKRLNKFLKIAILGLLSLVAVDGAAQSATSGTKKVTYTFKGSVLDNSAILSLFGRKQQLYLRSSGSKPAGVQDPDINCTTDGHVPPVGSSHDGGDFQHFDKHLLGGLSTLYVVEENEHAVVRFHNFKYEVARIQWRRRSQHALMTSKGGSWIEDYKGNEAGSFVEYGDEGGLESDYSTNGEIFYHTRDFVKFSETEPYKRYTGISTLNVEVNSKRSYQGIAVQDFDIYYFVPEPLISYTEITSSDPNYVPGKKRYDVEVTIGKDQHVGAFTKKDFNLDFNPGQLTKVLENVRVDGTTIRGSYILEVNEGAQGTATVYAKIMNNGEVAGKSQTSLKLELSPKKGFAFEGVRFWQSNTPNWIGEKKWTDPHDPTTTLSLGTDPGYLHEGNTLSTSTNLVYLYATSRVRMAREGVVAISFNMDVPAYTNVTRKVKFKITARKNRSSNGIGENISSEIRYFGESDGKNLGEATLNDVKFKSEGAQNDNQVLYTDTKDGSVTTADYKSASGWTPARPDEHYTWDMTNTADERGVADPVHNVSKPWAKFFTLAGNDMMSSSGITTQPNWTFEYMRLDGANNMNEFVFDYYAYITYDLDGGSGISTTGPTINRTKSQNNADPSKGGLPEAILPVTDSDLDASCNLTYTGLTKTTTDPSGRTINWKFIGWRDATDGEYYYPGDKFNPFDKSGECGKGPRTLVAQWEEIPAILSVTFMADGGKIGGTGNDYVQKQIEYGQGKWKGESNKNAPTASKVGYVFHGYTDAAGLEKFNANPVAATATSNAFYNASGTYVKGGDYFDTSGNYNSTDDLVLYAMFVLQTGGGAPTKYTITLDPNNTRGGNGSNQNVQMMKDSKDNNNVANYIPKSQTDGDGDPLYKFAGYYTEEVGGALVYAADGSSVKLVKMIPEDLTSIPATPAQSIFEPYNSTYWNEEAEWQYTGNTTLYAHWIPVGAKIYFNEGTNTTTNSAKWSLVSTSDTGTGINIPTYDMAEYEKVEIVRELKPGQWNTVCFPCDIYKYQCNELFDRVKVLTDLEVEDDNVSMKFSDSPAITAGVPYFVHMLENPNITDDTKDAYYDIVTKTLKLKDVETTRTPSSTSANDGSGNSVTMVGNFETQYHLAEGLVYLQDDKFYVSQNEYLVSGVNKKVYGNLRGFRCYFNVNVPSTPIKSLSLHLDLEGYDGWSGEDALEDINAEGVYSAGGGDIYDLSGRQLVGKPQRGLYIVNGRKYISK